MLESLLDFNYYGITKSKINYLDLILRIVIRMICSFKRKDHKSNNEFLK